MKLDAVLDVTGNIDVCSVHTGEVVATFKGTYYDRGKQVINKWINDNGYEYSHTETGWDRLTIWVIDEWIEPDVEEV